jgi:hypothetical protein
MTPDQRFAFIIGAIASVFTIMSVVLGLIYRTGKQTGKTLSEVENLQGDVRRIADSIDTHLQWHLGSNRRER